MDNKVRRALNCAGIISDFETMGFLSSSDAQDKEHAERRFFDSVSAIASDLLGEQGSADSAMLVLAQKISEFDQRNSSDPSFSDEDLQRVRGAVEERLISLEHASGTVKFLRSRLFKWMLIPFGLLAVWTNAHGALGDPIPPVPFLSEVLSGVYR